MFHRFWRSEDGNIAAIFAIAIIPIMTGVAGIVDFVSTSRKAAELQSMLDATGLAIGTKYYSGMSQAELEQFGKDFFVSNLRGSGDTSELDYTNEVPEFAVSSLAGGNANFIAVSAQITHEGLIGGATTWQATRHSYVRVAPGQPACVLALDPHASAAVKIQGSTQVHLAGCVVASNSNAADSISRDGSAQLSAKCVTTVGGTSGLSNSNTNLECGLPLEKQYPSFDPLAGIVLPPYTGCQSMPGGKTITLSPGTFCNKTWSGDITLDPGIYILRGGEIRLGGNGRLVGHGVTIFLMEGAEFSSNANEIIELSPPTSFGDPYAGITVYQERDNTTPLVLNGGAGSLISGFIYAPSAHVSYTGNSALTGAGDCIRIVGNTIEMTGNSAVSSDCEEELGGRAMFAGRHVTLVM